MRFIYLARNLANGKCYVGQTKDFDVRVKDHIRTAERGDGFKFHSAIRKYGKENFLFEVIEECENDLANERERIWIERFCSFKQGYNQTSGGDFAVFDEETIQKIRNVNSNLTPEQRYARGSALRGKHLSVEHKEKISKANLGKKPSPRTEETLRRMSDSMRGKNTGPKSDEHKRKLSEAHKGKSLSDEHKEKLRNVTVSAETREKLSAAGRGRLVSDETRLKQSEALRGKKRNPQSDEVKEHRAQKLRGRNRSEETKQKIRDAWARKREEKKKMRADDCDVQCTVAFDDFLNETSN